MSNDSYQTVRLAVGWAAGLALALALPLAGTAGCNPNRLDSSNSTDDSADGGSGSDGGSSFLGPCIAHPDSSSRCWLDGVTNGKVRNPVCTGGTQTSISGVVSIPAGTLPLYNAKVYISQSPAPDDANAPTNLPAIIHGATCDTCDKIVPLDAVTTATTDIDGKFTLTNVPVPPNGKALYLVIRVGKWRRSVRIENANSSTAGAAHIQRCTATQLDPEMTRLPRNQKEGDIPKIALSTGSADALECILRSKKLGLDDSEFSTEADHGSVNLYSGNGASQFSPALGGKGFTTSQPVPTASWWDSAPSWNQYDIVLLSCEGGPRLETKSDKARANLQSYINQGGRVFASHWHNGWIASGPAPLSTVATFPNGGSLGSVNADIVTTLQNGKPFERGVNLKQWLSSAKALTGGQLAINGAKNTIGTVNQSVSQPWVTYGTGASAVTQYFSFYAPVGAAADQQCGQMVFTDLHVSSADGAGDSSTNPFPSGCTTTTPSAQEKALIFMLFDLTNCVQPTIG